jgi:hypothetical protein
MDVFTNIKSVRTRAQMLRHTVSGQSCLMCLDKSQNAPQQISCTDTCARLSVERRQHEETSEDLSYLSYSRNSEMVFIR